MAVTVLLKVHNLNKCFYGYHRLLCTTNPLTCTGSTNTNFDTQNKPYQKTRQDEENNYDQEIRNSILAASMPFVLELGWSRNAISAGANIVGYPGVVHGLFPRGGAELVQYFYTDCNKKLSLMLKETHIQNSEKSVSKRIQSAIETRLRMIIPYKSKWPQALAIMSLPPNVPSSLANILTLIDDICFYSGDRSVDFSWYIRRIGLAGIYKTTELFMIQDNSEDCRETWLFLSNRITEAVAINSVIKQTENVNNQTREVFTSAFIMARNMLGLDWNR